MYRVRYRIVKGFATIRGRFLKMEAEKDGTGRTLWLYFKTANQTLPLDYHRDMQIEDITQEEI